MPKPVISYSLLISCPSDVGAYLENVEKAISSFNHTFGKQNGITIETMHWTKDTYSNMSRDGTAQGEINKQLLIEADMLVGIFWTRFGQPTEKFGSGTEEEINFMMDEGKPVILYFLDKPVPPSQIDLEQIKRINEFKEKHKNDGLYRVLESEAELSLKLRDELELRFSKEISKSNKVQYSDVQITKTILWVDDCPENNTYGRNYFENNGIEVIPALSTKQALKYLESSTVSVIISDMGRKEGPREGYVLLDALRKEGNNTPFIVFAGSRTREHIEETVRHGGQGCTNDFFELFEMVSTILLGTFVGQNY